MLQPRRTKFRKAHKGRIHGNAKGGYELNFGTYGLKAQEPAAYYCAPDRGRPPCHDPSHEARRPCVDPRVPGPAGFKEADRSPHG
jgi:hypothetical protein